MSRTANSARLWLELPADIQHRLHRCLESAASGAWSGDGVVIFFRADDVGVPGRKFNRLIDLFRNHQVPLTLAVVPAWLTGPRWQRVLELCGRDRHLWGWIQHGWRHRNHEQHGRKQEFGPSRTLFQKRKDLRLGLQRLGMLMGDNLLPVFTPPWNRCDQETLTALFGLGYKALSRDQGARPSAPLSVPDFPVNVDLHTRKDHDGESGWQSLFEELGKSLSSGFCGVMIHHQKMNDAAYDFLDLLLLALKRWRHARLVHLGTVIERDHCESL